MFYDPTMLLIIPGLLLGLYAQFKLSAIYHRYIRVPTRSGLSGAEAARKVLDQAGLTQVGIQEIGGELTDHYDPSKRTLFLSSANYRERTLAAVGVAAHEAGHALQHQAAYAPLKFRMALVPVTQVASFAWMGLFLLGMIFAITKLLWVGVAVFAVITVFQLITLPVEFDASRRARVQLAQLGIVAPDESDSVRQVLNAAALTYVAGLVTTILQLLRLVLLARSRD